MPPKFKFCRSDLAETNVCKTFQEKRVKLLFKTINERGKCFRNVVNSKKLFINLRIFIGVIGLNIRFVCLEIL